jgi:type IV secretory pathway VirJ component
MRRWIPVLGIAYILLLSSCSIMKRNRFSKHQGEQSNELDLPVVLYPAENANSRRLLVLMSGDGGWLEFNDQLAAGFAKKGYHVVGLNSRSYFWEQRSPAQTADDVRRLILHYTKQYRASRIYLAGYSFGADVIPFIYNRLPVPTKRAVIAIGLFSPFASTDFMVHTADLLNLSGDNKTFKVAPEVQKIRIPVYCFYGEQENPRPLSEIKKRNFHLTLLSGDHHYEPSESQKIINTFLKIRSLKLR